nr:FlgD immunoglobulin-like domain containing protein [Candidatus Syntrophosphaera sp.]
YGLERFRVGVSTLPSVIVQGFTYINDGEYVEAPTEWHEYVYDISAYDNQAVYVAIRCVSNDAFVFYVDDFSAHSDGGSLVSSDDPSVPALVTELQGNYPNPFNPETTISFSLKEAGPVTLDIYNVKGQLVRRLVDEALNSGRHSVVFDGRDANGEPVSSGMYFCQMRAGSYGATRKMILMK